MEKSYHEADFNRISAYLLSVFQFAGHSKNTVFVEKDWLNFAGEDGKFFGDLYKKKAKNGKGMRQAVDKLFAMKADRKEAIYQAIAHDMKFAEKPDKKFEFESVRLEADEKKVVEDFFLYFYLVVLSTAHFKLQGLTKAKIGREELAETYFQGANETIKNVCPVCLQSMTNAEKETDVEHFFAKSLVPCLALHPNNMYFICPVCNKTYKGVEPPMYGEETDIRNTFLPYIDTVKDKVRIKFCHEKQADSLQFIPLDKNEKNIDKKIEVFNKLFHLEERWSDMIELYYNTMHKRYADLGFDSQEELEKELSRDLRKDRAVSGIRPDRYVETQYQEWICQSRLDAFYESMKSGR